MWVRIHTQGDSQELLFGKQLASDSFAVLSSQAMTALWVTLTLRDVSRVLTTEILNKSIIPSEVYQHTYGNSCHFLKNGKYKVGFLFWKERV